MPILLLNCEGERTQVRDVGTISPQCLGSETSGTLMLGLMLPEI